jgi:hypothetical protein
MLLANKTTIKSLVAALVFSSSVLSLVLSIHPAVASDLVTQDIILSSNGAAEGNDQDYNVFRADGWVRRTINWEPSGSVKKVSWRCVDNCQDARKFSYKIQLKNGEMVLVMRATNREQGLIRVQLTALIE